VLGTDPLDKAFTGERSYLRIGQGNRIREHYTISRGTAPESATTIGDGNYIMTSGHIAHNCRIGNDTVICSCALVAGHVEIEDQAFISGGIGIHQYTRIGRLAMVAGMTRVNLDLAPFFLYSGYHMKPDGAERGGPEARRVLAEPTSRRSSRPTASCSSRNRLKAGAGARAHRGRDSPPRTPRTWWTSFAAANGGSAGRLVACGL
jgi:acyl-ACP--UDP-N-acetylglucosamine O-acyltransferase